MEITKTRTWAQNKLPVILTASALALSACSNGGKQENASDNSEAEPSPTQFVKGCSIYGVYSQRQFDPMGTALRTSPSTVSEKSATQFGLNEVIPVDGWMHTGLGPNYPDNPEPLNTDIWFHVAYTGGYVSYEGVRGRTTSPQTPLDADRLLAELKPECEYKQSHE